MSEEASSNKKVVVERLFDTPRALVWDAWTQPEQFSQWWCPDMFTIPLCELDVRVGGKTHIEMKGPDGTIYPSIGEYTEVDKPERLTCVTSPLDNQGGKLFEVRQTAEFTEVGSKTKLVYTSEVISFTEAAAPYLAGMEPGLNQSMQKLEQYLSK
jgi:uncharacterized protein YndB with AHSA1/START domain